ncbi:MAG: DUF1801 domain-containing protein [Pyrinomonadaceae bacterium]
MSKVELKTKATDASVDDFLNSVSDEQQREESTRLLKIFERVTGEAPKMWGPAIVGFGTRTLRYDSGREMDWMVTGFSPRKGNLTLYIMDGFDRYDEMLAALGKHKTGKSCLYVKRLSDIDQSVLEQLIAASIKHITGE